MHCPPEADRINFKGYFQFGIHMSTSAAAFVKPIELLAPAGNMEKLEIAIAYGADAVYLGGSDFSLRNFSDNFSLEEIEEALRLAHENNVKVYVACNVYPRSPEIPALENYIQALAQIRPDALIVSDPGLMDLAREHAPNLPLHLSTQANTTNFLSARFWKKHGVTRINAARELSLEEIRILCEKSGIEVECFVHGAMCIAYSGRCLLSTYMAGRDSNRGLCAHPCRWEYAVMEKKRPGQFFPVEEDERGSYVFSSRDLCMIDHLPELLRTGLSSLKIEGRMKTVHYLAVVIGVYREAIDRYLESPENFCIDPEWYERLDSLHHRGYGTGFYLGEEEGIAANYDNLKGAEPKALFVGKILSFSEETGLHKVLVKNRFLAGDTVEILSPGRKPMQDRVLSMENPEGPVAKARPNEILDLYLENIYPEHSLLRIREWDA